MTTDEAQAIYDKSRAEYHLAMTTLIHAQEGLKKALDTLNKSRLNFDAAYNADHND